MWKERSWDLLFASALVLFLLLSVPGHTQDTDSVIVQNQERIISIVLSLNESANTRELIYKQDMQNWQDERSDWLKEKETLQKQVDSLPQIEKDMQTLKESLDKQSKQLKKEQWYSKCKTYAIVTCILVIALESVAISIK